MGLSLPFPPLRNQLLRRRPFLRPHRIVQRALLVRCRHLAVPAQIQPGTRSKCDLAKIRLIVLVTIFCVLPLVGLWLCCYKMKHMLCFGGGKRRQHYNAAHPAQIPGGVYLVPVNAFVPPDQGTGYSARVDTPGNPTEMVTAAPLYQQTGVVYPPRAVTPMTEKSGGWKSVFRH